MNKTNYTQNIFPQINSAKSHFELAKKSSFWVGHLILSFFLVIPVLGRLIHLIEQTYKKSLPLPSQNSKDSSLSEKKIEVIEKKEISPTITPPDPLELSSQDLALFSSGLLTCAFHTTGLPWGLNWLGTSWGSSFLRASHFTTPTRLGAAVSLSILMSYIMTTQPEGRNSILSLQQSQEEKETDPPSRRPFSWPVFANHFVKQFYVPAPIQTGVQTYLS